MRELLEEGRTNGRVGGLVSRAGREFDAYLRRDGGDIVFEFRP